MENKGMDLVKEFFQKKSLIQLVAIFMIVLFFAIALVSSLHRSFNHDEFEAIHSAWKIFSGEKIYLDFLQQHHFLLYYLLGPVFSIFGASVASIIAARMIMLVLAVGIAWLTYRIAELVYDKKIALLSVFFLSTTVIFIQKAIEVRPDVPLVFSCLVSVYFLISYLKLKSVWRLLLSSTFLFIAFLFLQKAVFLAVLIGLFFVYKVYKKQIEYKVFFLYWGLFGMYIGLFILHVSVTFTLSEYIFLNWTINTKLLNTFPLYKYLLISMYQNPLFWLLFLIGIVIMIKKKSFNMMAFFSVGLLGFVFLAKTPFPQYYLMALPLISIIAAVQADNFLAKKRLIMAILLILSAAGSIFTVWYAWDDNSKQLKKIEYVLSVTSPNDYVYDGDANFNIFRKDINYFWFSVKPKTGVLVAYRLLRNYDYDVYKLIDKLKPIVISNSFIKKKNPAVMDNYEKSKIFNDLYIRK